MDVLADLPPAEQAHKRASKVPLLARAIEVEPGVRGRWNKLLNLVAELDALAGVSPEPGAPELSPPVSGAFHHALAAFYMRHRRTAFAIDACRAGVVEDAYDIGLRHIWLEALRAAGRLQEAAPVIDLPPDALEVATEAEVFALLRHAERLLLKVGATALAFAAMERAAAFTPASDRALRYLVVRAETLGDMARAAEYRARLGRLMKETLPETLADGLAKLGGRNLPLHAPEAAVDWAWRLADRGRWSKDGWLQASANGGRSTNLLIRWWLSHPERMDQLAALIDMPDLEAVRAGQAAGRAQIVVSSHNGPLPAAIHLFEKSGLPFRTLGGDGMDRLGGQRTLLPAGKPLAASRELVSLIRQAGVIAVAADAPTPGDRIELEFLGRKIGVKSLPARLAQRYGCDTWWCQPLWRGDRIVIELERLPDPRAEEPADAWQERWALAYLKRLKRVMRGDPRNLNLNGGVWRFAEAPSP